MVIILCVLLLFVSGCSRPRIQEVPLQYTTSSQNNGNILFKEKKKYFMNLEYTDTLETSFVFKNNMGKIIAIDSVKTFCGCTKAEYPKYAIRMGDTDSIRISISTPPDRNFFSNSALVYFHKQKPIALKIIAKRKTSYKNIPKTHEKSI